MVKHTQTIRWLLPMNCLNVFDHFLGLALKGPCLILNFRVKIMNNSILIDIKFIIIVIIVTIIIVIVINVIAKIGLIF